MDQSFFVIFHEILGELHTYGYLKAKTTCKGRKLHETKNAINFSDNCEAQFGTESYLCSTARESDGAGFEETYVANFCPFHGHGSVDALGATVVLRQQRAAVQRH